MQSRTRPAWRIVARATLLAATSSACTPAAPVLALGATAEHAPRGEPSRPPPPTEGAASSEPPAPPWNLAAELRRVHPASPRTPSEHLTGQLDGAIFADEGAAAYPALGPLRPIPVGATLIEHLYAHGAPDVAAYFAMTKRPPGYDPPGGDWEYLIVDPAGHVEQRGRLSLCARCHADAPHDRLFGTGR